MNIYFIRYEDRRNYYSHVNATPSATMWNELLRETIQDVLEQGEVPVPTGLYGEALHEWWTNFANENQIEVQIDIGQWRDVKEGQIFHWSDSCSALVSGGERNA